MAIVTPGPASSPGLEYDFTPRFNRYKGMYDKNPILRSIINGIADAVTTSYKVKGRHARSAQRMLNKVYGTGKSTFKLELNRAVIVAMICGNAFFEIVRDPITKECINLVLLDSQNVTMHVKNGRITYYQDNASGHQWAPKNILHIANRYTDSRPYGQGDIEPLENLLIDLYQIWDDSARIFHRYIKPMHIVYLNTDLPNKITQFTDLWDRTRKTPETDLIVPVDIVNKIDRVAIPQGGTLDPLQQERLLVQRLLQSFRYPEIALGSGAPNSDEVGRMLYSGLGQLVRWIAQRLEDQIECQLFKEQYGYDSHPKLVLSYSAEPEEEKFKRHLDVAKWISSTDFTDDIKRGILIPALEEMGYNVRSTSRTNTTAATGSEGAPYSAARS